MSNLWRGARLVLAVGVAVWVASVCRAPERSELGRVDSAQSVERAYPLVRTHYIASDRAGAFRSETTPEILARSTDPVAAACRSRNLGSEAAPRIQAQFPSRFDAATAVTAIRARVEARPVDALPGSVAEVTPRGDLLYANAFPACDVLYRAGERKVEEFLVVKAGSGRRSWSWDLTFGNLTTREASGGEIEFMDKGGVARLVLCAAEGRDAAGRALKLGVGLEREWSAAANGHARLTLTADLSGLSLPVVIDPSWEVRPRIIGGTEVPESTWPTVAELINTPQGYTCTATLICSDVVLTAGHCVTDGAGNVYPATNFQVRLGPTYYDVATVTKHPTWDDNSYTEGIFDIAVLELTSIVVGITPSPIDRQPPVSGLTLTKVGYGNRGDGINGVTAPGPAPGMVGVGDTQIDVVTPTFVEWDYDFPPAAPEANTGRGDSGGPGFINRNGVLVVASVTSGGLFVGQGNDNVGFGDHSYDTRVDAVATFIDGFCNLIISGPSASPNPTQFGAPTLFTVQVQAGVNSILWNFGDGTTGSGLNVFHTYGAAGTYTATVTVSNPSGEVQVRIVTVTVSPVVINSPIISGPSASPPLPVAQETVNFAVQISQFAFSPTWNFGDGSTATGTVVNHAFATAGTYTVTVIATDSLGQTAIRTIQVIVLPNNPPTISSGISVSPPTPDQFEDVVFTVGGTDPDGRPVTITWDFGDGTTASGASVLHAYTGVGTFTVTVTISDGVNSISQTASVTVQSPPQSLFVGQLKATLRFAAAGKDQAKVKGSFSPLGLGASVDGLTATLDVAGATATFTLNRNGKGKSGFHSIRLKFRTGVWTMLASLRNGSFRTVWADDGLVEGNIDGASVAMPVSLNLGGVTYSNTRALNYTARLGKKGTAR